MMADLEHVLQLQFNHVRQLSGKHRLAALPRLLEFVHREPRLAAIATDPLGTAKAAVGEMVSLEQTLRLELLKLWTENEGWLLAAWDQARDADPGNPAFKAHGSPHDFTEALESDSDWHYPTHEAPDESVAANGVGQFFPKIRHWLSCLSTRHERVETFEFAYSHLLERHREGVSRYVLEGMAAPGVALHRLTQTARGIVPKSDHSPVVKWFTDL